MGCFEGLVPLSIVFHSWPGIRRVACFAPLVEGRQLSDNEFAALDEELRDEFFEKIEKLEDALIESLIELPRWKRE